MGGMGKLGGSLPPHRIHLRGPWEYQWQGPSDAPATAPAGRIPLPADWRTLFGPTAGTAEFRRRFHRPTNLQPADRVLLGFDGLGGTATITLNGHPLGTLTPDHPTARFEITDHLTDFNDLRVTITFDPATTDRGGLWGAVTLEIHAG